MGPKQGDYEALRGPSKGVKDVRTNGAAGVGVCAFAPCGNMDGRGRRYDVSLGRTHVLDLGPRVMGGYFGWARLPWLGLVFGVVVLLGAVVLYTRPEQAHPWGIAILVASTVNLLFGMRGILAGLLGITGRALAIEWRPGEVRKVRDPVWRDGG